MAIWCHLGVKNYFLSSHPAKKLPPNSRSRSLLSPILSEKFQNGLKNLFLIWSNLFRDFFQNSFLIRPYPSLSRRLKNCISPVLILFQVGSSLIVFEICSQIIFPSFLFASLSLDCYHKSRGVVLLQPQA